MLLGKSKTKIPLQLDSLAVLHRDTAAIGLYDILIESICRSIRMIERSIIEQKYFNRIDEFGVPKTFNFLPKEMGHFFSCVYFSKSNDDGMCVWPICCYSSPPQKTLSTLFIF